MEEQESERRTRGEVKRIREDLDGLTVNFKELRQEVTDWRQKEEETRRKNTDAILKLTEGVGKLTDGVGKTYDDMLAIGRIAKMVRSVIATFITIGAVGIAIAFGYQHITGESIVPKHKAEAKAK
jgi:hypothetical protein